MVDVFYYMPVTDILVDSSNSDSILLQAERLVDADFPGITVHSLVLTSDTLDFPISLDDQDWPVIRRSFLLEIGFAYATAQNGAPHHAVRVYDWENGTSRMVYQR